MDFIGIREPSEAEAKFWPNLDALIFEYREMIGDKKAFCLVPIRRDIADDEDVKREADQQAVWAFKDLSRGL